MKLGFVIFLAVFAGGLGIAQAANFKTRFIKTCTADVDTVSGCECRFKSLNKPKNSAEENLVMAVLARNDAKVEALIRKANNWRSVVIINSMTSGLMACIKS